MIYEHYLLTDHWKKLRRIKLEQCGYKCERCESTFYLQVHHIRYDQGWLNTSPSDLEVLCFYCHKKEHGLLRQNDRPIYTQKQREAIVSKIAPISCTKNRRSRPNKKAVLRREQLHGKALRERNKQIAKANRKMGFRFKSNKWAIVMAERHYMVKVTKPDSNVAAFGH